MNNAYTSTDNQATFSKWHNNVGFLIGIFEMPLDGRFAVDHHLPIFDKQFWDDSSFSYDRRLPLWLIPLPVGRVP